MWKHVIEELEGQKAVGDAFPVACHQHPDAIEYVAQPGKLLRIAPDGKFLIQGLFCGKLTSSDRWVFETLRNKT